MGLGFGEEWTGYHYDGTPSNPQGLGSQVSSLEQEVFLLQKRIKELEKENRDLRYQLEKFYSESNK